MKKIIFFIAFTFISITCFSQDILSMKRGASREVIITEITPTLVRYRLLSEPNGKGYFVYKDDVAAIKYKDGRVVTFNSSANQVVDVKNSPMKKEKEDNQQSIPIVKSQENMENKSQSANNQSQTNNFIRSDTEVTVYLKDGSIIQGTIIDQIPNESITIKSVNGNVTAYYTMNEIDRIVNGTSDENNQSLQDTASKNKNIENRNSSTNNRNQTSNSSWSNNDKVIVYLKDGSSIQGTIIDQIPNESITIKSSNGKITAYYTMNEIDRIEN